ncbi:MAG: hypothetical protein ACFE7E_02915 [Candidatus Hodarchaeota archaeon]
MVFIEKLATALKSGDRKTAILLLTKALENPGRASMWKKLAWSGWLNALKSSSSGALVTILVKEAPADIRPYARFLRNIRKNIPKVDPSQAAFAKDYLGEWLSLLQKYEKIKPEKS